jgi:tetratricopeptide (TPR) repeat protein
MAAQPLCYHPTMRLLIACLVLGLVAASPSAAADALAEARRLYNMGQYDAAEKMAREALRSRESANGARLVLGRIHLERFRTSAKPEDLTAGRDSLRSLDPGALDQRERLELLVGLGETLYLEERFGAAAEIFDAALGRASTLGPAAHERLIDWWATAVDRIAQQGPRESRDALYQRLLKRMDETLAQDPGIAPASYWVAAAARGTGDLERAWHASKAAWVRSQFARDKAPLRADIDRLVVQGIIPERAARLQQRDPKAAPPTAPVPTVATMTAEWESFKEAWK